MMAPAGALLVLPVAAAAVVVVVVAVAVAPVVLLLLSFVSAGDGSNGRVHEDDLPEADVPPGNAVTTCKEGGGSIPSGFFAKGFGKVEGGA